MTAHTCVTLDPDCWRCELNMDEMKDNYSVRIEFEHDDGTKDTEITTHDTWQSAFNYAAEFVQNTTIVDKITIQER